MRWAGIRERTGTPGGWPRISYQVRACAVFVFMGAVLAAAQQGQQPGSNNTPAQNSAPGRSATGTPPQAAPATQNGTQTPDTANEERRKQIADDGAKLLALATGLKAEVDKTNQDTLSLEVVRKAEEIEKLAHAVKERMKQTAGVN